MNVVIQKINPWRLLRGPVECMYPVDQHLMNLAQPEAKACSQSFAGSNT